MDDARCDDGDPCTLDRCAEGACVHEDDPVCATAPDAGAAVADAGAEPLPDDGGCSCGAAGRGGRAPLALGLLGLALAMRRRRAAAGGGRDA